MADLPKGIHNLTDEDWERCRRLAYKLSCYQVPLSTGAVPVAQARAYLDAVAALRAGLTEPQARWLVRFVDGWGYGGVGGRQVLRSLEALRLAEPEAGCPTCGSVSRYVVVVHPLGRAVAHAGGVA